jgi:hypothetical protein
MRTFEELTSQEQTRALKASVAWLTDDIAHGVLEVTLINPRRQHRLDTILSDARVREMPRLGKLAILNDKVLMEEIGKLALVDASEHIYNEFGDRMKSEGYLQ